MGFLDKAKKLAEQAQTKLDEVQQQVNKQGSSSPSTGAPITEYDKHGRPVPPEQSASPPHGDPLSAPPTPPTPPSGPTPDPSAPAANWSSSGPPAPPAPGLPPTGSPAPVEGHAAPLESPGVPGAPSSPPAGSSAPPPPMPGAPSGDPNRPSYEPPKLTGGDPLAG